MRTITTIGLDIAKSVFQVHGVDAVGQVVIRRQLKRRYVLAFFQKLPSCPCCGETMHFVRTMAHAELPPMQTLECKPCGLVVTAGASSQAAAGAIATAQSLTGRSH